MDSTLLAVTSNVGRRYGRLLLLLSVVLLLIFGWLGGLSTGVANLSMPFAGTSSPNGQTRLFEDALFEIEGEEWDGQYVQQICEDVEEWRPGFYFQCIHNTGGFGNLKNYVLTCLRYAIESGATGMVMPTFQLRANDLVDIFGNSVPFDYMFDEQHFKRHVRRLCPQIKIFDRKEDIPNIDKATISEDGIKHIQNVVHDSDQGLQPLNQRVATLSQDMQTFFEGKYGARDSFERPILMIPPWPTVDEWPGHAVDSTRFFNTFGRIMRVRQDFRDIALTLLREMQMQFPQHFGPAPGEPVSTPLLSYLGIHLRIEADAVPDWGWATAEECYQAAQKFVEENTAGLIYIATGDVAGIERMTQICAEMPSQPQVISKTTLLNGTRTSEQGRAAWRQLQKLTWDQQAVVDYLVLLRCYRFSGMTMSTYSMAIASRRHILTRGIDSSTIRNNHDKYSSYYGSMRQYVSNWVYMRESQWP